MNPGMDQWIRETLKGMTIHNGSYLFPNVRLGKNVIIFPGAVIGRPPVSTGATRRQIEPSELLPVEIGDECVIGANAVIYSGVRVGHHSMVGDTARILTGCVVGSYSLIAMGVSLLFEATIGDRVRILDNTVIGSHSVLEEGVFVGAQVVTADSRWMGRRAEEHDSWALRGATIHRFAAIGNGAQIMPRLEIGEYAMVGAGAVVTQDVPPRVVVAGVPARVIRSVKSEELER